MKYDINMRVMVYQEEEIQTWPISLLYQMNYVVAYRGDNKRFLKYLTEPDTLPPSMLGVIDSLIVQDSQQHRKGIVKGKIPVSRFHYTDLVCAAMNDRTGDTQKILDSYQDRLEIIEHPEPGQFTMDLSLAFLYPHVVKFPVHSELRD